jgi:hypothetical protein
LTYAKIFTKAYRLVNVKKFNELKHFVFPDKNNKLSIFFYGLSLNENDYSYYQSIFDKYDIYENKNISINFVTKCVFKNDYTSSVYDLIRGYGNTFDNQDHGKNLLTLLLIENRLKIVAID